MGVLYVNILSLRVSMFSLRRICLLLPLLCTSFSWSIHFPDTLELQKTFQVLQRQEGLPSRLVQKKSDSLYLYLQWKEGGIIAARYEQKEEFSPSLFNTLTEEYGQGATWHEMVSVLNVNSPVLKFYPGLQQQWNLKGYRNEKGWLGSGLKGRVFYLAFRENSPNPIPVISEELKLNPTLFTYLDSASNWKHKPCKEISTAYCFQSLEEKQLQIQLNSKLANTIDIWMEGVPMLELINNIEQVTAKEKPALAQDLSTLLHTEAEFFLVKISQACPALFNWSSYQFQDWKGGQISTKEWENFLRNIDVNKQKVHDLRILNFTQPTISMELNFNPNGLYHLNLKTP